MGQPSHCNENIAKTHVKKRRKLPTLAFESPLDYRGNPLDFACVQPTMGWL
jgi:hypothetical protein